MLEKINLRKNLSKFQSKTELYHICNVSITNKPLPATICYHHPEFFYLKLVAVLNLNVDSYVAEFYLVFYISETHTPIVILSPTPQRSLTYLGLVIHHFTNAILE